MQSSFTNESLQVYASLVADKYSQDFSETGEYDFTRCVKPNGEAYGTSGKCRKGVEAMSEEERSVTRERGRNHQVLLDQLKTLDKKLLLRAWKNERQDIKLSPKVTLSAHRVWTGLGKPSLRYKVNDKPVSKTLLAKTLQDSGVTSLEKVASTELD
jgi:hypothetical protein